MQTSTGSTSIQNSLVSLHEHQSERAAKAAASFRLGNKLGDAMDLAKAVMSGVVESFGSSEGMTGSWIDAQPLPLQLLTQPRLTVDLTLDVLGQERPYGLSLGALCRLAKGGFVHLNLRDYDDDLERGLPQHSKHADRIEHILEKAPEAVYFGSAVRKAIFDAMLAKQTGRAGGDYSSYRAEAREALGDVAKRYSALPDDDAHVQRAMFRSKRTDIAATYWHYAYLKSAEQHLPATAIAHLHGTFDLVQRTQDVGHLVDLMRLLRLLHLNFTAPITASFGTTYNMRDDEYVESINLRLNPDAPLSRIATSDRIVGEFLSFLFSSAPAQDFPTGSVKARQEKAEVDDREIDALIKVLERQNAQRQEAATILRELASASWRAGQAPEFSELLARYVHLNGEMHALLSAEARLNKVLTVGAAATGALAGGGLGIAIPWLAAAAAAFLGVTALVGPAFTQEAAQLIVEKCRLTNDVDRVLYRVNRIFV